MKNFIRKHLKPTFFAILALFSVILASCDSLPAECLSKLEEPFRADVCGEVDGEKISAAVFCDPTEHKTKEIYDRVTVTFKEGALDGITATLRSDGKATVRLRNSRETLPLYSGLVEPFNSLCPETKPYSTKKTENGFEIVFKEDKMLVTCYFDRDGIIKSIDGEVNGRQVQLEITNFEQLPK